MREYEEKFNKYIKENNIKAEQIFFQELVDHKENVLDTIKEKDINFNDIVKTVVFLDLDKKLEYGNAVVAIVPASFRVSKDKLRKINNSRIKISGPDEVLILTSYPAGGVPPFGFKARFYMDESLKNKNEVYAGGGSIRTLVKTTIKEILKATKAEVVNIIENLDNNLKEDLIFAKRTEEAYKKYEKGGFKTMDADEFIKKLKKM